MSTQTTEAIVGKKIQGTVVLMKKNVAEVADLGALVSDDIHELFRNRVSLQLVSAQNSDSAAANELKGKLGKKAFLENWIGTTTLLVANESAYKVTFDWDEDIGIPGAFLICNAHNNEFYLKSLTLEDVPGEGRMHFVCNSWIYPTTDNEKYRIFFINKTYLPNRTPLPLRKYREEELTNLRGDGKKELKERDRVYDYDYYNDLGEPAKSPRPILGGSTKYPYPRRGRTGRPRSEIVHFIKPEIKALFKKNINEFNSLEDIMKLYGEGSSLSHSSLLDHIRENIPLETLKEILRTDGESHFNFPLPQVIKEDKSAWRTDEEFAREMLAGVNPVVICLLQEFPPTSKLDPKLYGDQSSSIDKSHIEKNLDGLSTEEALEQKRLFILDHHDHLMPCLRKINTTSTKTYASRTLLFLKDDETLKPLAIELSLPHPEEDQLGAISKVLTPAENDVEGSMWQLAKAYVSVNDAGYHQLISHWLHTHAVIEPFIIATNRQLSVLHPIHKLLYPHFRDTMTINALSRQALLNADGLFEATVFPAKYSMEMSSFLYKKWVFTDQALPEDLKKRGMAIDDLNSPHGVSLLIKDYPYAVDGLEIWSAIKMWVKDYCNFYYKSNEIIQEDVELQTWWKEVREEGHGDKKDESWWPKLHTCDELVNICTIIIWVASALHAAINFGQYPYAAYLPNRPTISRRFMPEKGTPEYDELLSNPEKVFLRTITSHLQTVIGMSLLEILSRHSSDEIYLGQRDTPEWTSDVETLEAFKKFGNKLAEIEEKIVERNNDKESKNRIGPVNMPYTLLYPTGEIGLIGKGIPNSISI
ncbi:probable linoleate 9S-lipoxygenase 5 isoform X2 [Carica papaya]|uniref:probable linoleate 9S-lipoxygenase 5 isoform X2 n=1 Tax=Carica papaya TaxID=3649 RepID=UPI000B8C8060|nr:probable linoleate 9S-lipoxygenase 5 isoform X2 [Carica papaya]